MAADTPIPAYVQSVRREADSVELAPVRRLPVRRPGNEPVLVSVVRDEIDLLPPLLDHYRGLGVTHFVLLDNGSEDGSVEFLSTQSDVDVFRVDRPFNWVLKQGWIHRVIREYGRQRWYLCVDADEHVVFDGCARHTLGDLASGLDRRGIRRARGVLVDMYAPGPVLEYRLDRRRPLEENFSLFDADGYEERQVPRMISRRGGPRKRCFTSAGLEIDPELTKYPLFRLEPGEVMANPHHIHPYADNFLSACYLGILHFKFLPGLMAKIRAAIETEAYWEGSLEYKAYLEVLTANPDLVLQYAGSRSYRGPKSLVETGLIARFDWQGENPDRPDTRP